MNEKIVIFGSYNKGPEYEEKLSKVDELRIKGLDIHLFYLLALTYDDRLPEQFADQLITKNIEVAISRFQPTVLAFHNGLTLNLRNEEFKTAIEKVKPKYPELKFLIEHLNNPDMGSNFKQKQGFLGWCQENFISTHELYDILWKRKK